MSQYYNPSLSLWLGVDPLADEMPDISAFAYSFNNPVRFIDPDGRMPEDIIGGDPPGTSFLVALGNAIYNEGIDLAYDNLNSMGIAKYAKGLEYKSTNFTPFVNKEIEGYTSREHTLNNVNVNVDGYEITLDKIDVVLRHQKEFATISEVNYGERESGMFGGDDAYVMYLDLKGAQDQNVSYSSNMKLGKCFLNGCNVDDYNAAVNSVRVQAVESVFKYLPQKNKYRVQKAWSFYRL